MVHRTRLGINHPALETVTGDVTDEDALKRLMTDCKAIVHVAGLVRGRSEADFLPVNAEGASRVARLARTMRISPRLILMSSLAAREPGLSAYAASKRKGEEQLAAECEGSDLSWAVMRPTAIYGPGDRELLPLFSLMARGITPVFGLPDGRVSLLHVSDLAHATIALINSDARGVYELHDGRENGYSLDDIATIVESVTARGRGVRIRIPEHLLRGVASANLVASRLFGYQPMLTPGKVNELRHSDWVCDNTKLNRATGWQPMYSLNDGLQSLLNGASRKKNEVISNVI